jgi:acetate kinase
MPEIEKILPLPKIYYDSGIKRYGFHGLSYEYISSALPENLKNKRVIVAHLGNGSSVCAIREGKSVATSMGFSTLDGLMMGTRAGALDAGVLLYLLQQKQMSTAKIETLLYKESGLLGVSGISSDMRELEASTNPQAKLAIDHYCHIAAKHIASLIPSICGMDALIFTGGIGEHSANVREKILSQLAWLGKIETLVIPTNEELVIARACKKLLN